MRSSVYYYQHHRSAKVRDILKTLEKRQDESHSKASAQKINSILTQRRKKLKQIRNLAHKDIQQDPFKPKKIQQTFSVSSPISSGEKFLLEKYRTKLLEPQKARNPQPNIRSGSLDESMISNLRDNNHPEVLNKKFSEYIALVDSQTGSYKKKQIEKKRNLSSPNPIKIRMKSTLFKKLAPNTINFYKPPIQHISRMNSWAENQSKRFSESDNLSKQYNTIDVSVSIPHSREATQISQTIDILKKSHVQRSRISKVSRANLASGKISRNIKPTIHKSKKAIDQLE